MTLDQVKCSKYRLISEEVASEMISMLFWFDLMAGKDLSSFNRMNAYLCESCDFWHVGHNPKKKNIKKATKRREIRMIKKEYPYG